jgi:hypothetical protein
MGGHGMKNELFGFHCVYFLDDMFLAVCSDRWRVYYSGPISFISRQQNMIFLAIKKESSSSFYPFFTTRASIYPLNPSCPVLLHAFGPLH